MNKENKKIAKQKYKLFINLLIDNFNKNKELLTETDLKQLKKADQIISELIEKIIKKQINEIKKERDK